jgi:sporulation protein YlmC with PRC-barrel domain
MSDTYIEDTSGRTVKSSGIKGDLADPHTGPGPEVMAASTLQGNPVKNKRHDDLGIIKEIMIDVSNGDIAYAVLESGGLLGLGSKLFAIPWHALVLDTDRKAFILDVDLEKLKNAPGFDKDHWPDMADLRAYYGVVANS